MVQQMSCLSAALLYVLLGVATSARGVSRRPWPSIDVSQRQPQKLASGQDVQAGYTSSTNGTLTTFTLLVANGGTVPITDLKLRLDRRSVPFAKQDLMNALSLEAQQGVEAGAWAWKRGIPVQTFQLQVANLEGHKAPLPLSDIAEQAVVVTDAAGKLVWDQRQHSNDQPGTTVLQVSFDDDTAAYLVLSDDQ